MLTLQWHCLECNRSTSPVAVPYGYNPPFSLTDLYCIVCGEVTSHSAGVTEPGCSPIRTMGDVLAEARADEAVENGILEMLTR